MTMMGAISGLLINNDYMNMISNNIANASTIGYKSSKPIFFDMFSHSFYSTSTLGSGVGISNTIQNFNSGMLVETGRDLDLGIIQDGFFRVLDPQGNIHYTRNGQFLLDQNKNIINMQGMHLTGQNKPDPKNAIKDRFNIEPINLKNAHILKAKPTSSINLSAILNSNVDPVINDNNSDMSIKQNYYTMTIYNKNEKKEDISIFFNKIDNKKWKVYIKSNNTLDNDNTNKINNSFDIEFNSEGQLITEKLFNIQPKNTQYENITLNLNGTLEQSDITNSYLEHSSQDGYLQGSLKTFDVLPNGEIIGTYSNQQTAPMAQIILSKFINPEKLQPESGNLWSATTESGQEDMGIAGHSGFGVLSAKTLESSNVDLNQELINMIIAQRNYQSNAQSFKTEDKIINTLINLR